MVNSLIGIDCIETHVYVTNPIDFVSKEVRNKNGNLIFRFDKTRKENTYAASIILPTIIRDTNLQGFGINDCQELCYVTDFIKEYLYKYLGTHDLSLVEVQKIEVNANKTVPHKVDIDMVIELIEKALLSLKIPLREYRTGKPYYKSLNRSIINGIKTARDRSGRYYLILYNKTAQSGLHDGRLPIFRLELEYNKAGICNALKPKNGVIFLEDILQERAIAQLTHCYISDVGKRFMPNIDTWFYDVVEKNIENLMSSKSAFSSYMTEQESNKCDFDAFRTAYERLGKPKNSTRVQLSRIKKRVVEEYTYISDGTYKLLKDFEKDILRQK